MADGYTTDRTERSPRRSRATDKQDYSSVTLYEKVTFDVRRGNMIEPKEFYMTVETDSKVKGDEQADLIVRSMKWRLD